MNEASDSLAADLERLVLMVNAQGRELFGLTARDVGRLLQDLELSYRPVLH